MKFYYYPETDTLYMEQIVSLVIETRTAIRLVEGAMAK